MPPTGSTKASPTPKKHPTPETTAAFARSVFGDAAQLESAVRSDSVLETGVPARSANEHIGLQQVITMLVFAAADKQVSSVLGAPNAGPLAGPSAAAFNEFISLYKSGDTGGAWNLLQGQPDRQAAGRLLNWGDTASFVRAAGVENVLAMAGVSSLDTAANRVLLKAAADMTSAFFAGDMSKAWTLYKGDGKGGGWARGDDEHFTFAIGVAKAAEYAAYERAALSPSGRGLFGDYPTLKAALIAASGAKFDVGVNELAGMLSKISYPSLYSSLEKAIQTIESAGKVDLAEGAVRTLRFVEQPLAEHTELSQKTVGALIAVDRTASGITPSSALMNGQLVGFKLDSTTAQSQASAVHADRR